MRKLYPYLTIGLLLALFIAAYSCKKVNAINNEQVVETPFSLFFADTAGTVYNSTDGKTDKVIFEADGFPCRALCVSYSNILMVKQNLYISTNNGGSFNHSYDSVASYPRYACNGFPFNLNQSMIIDIPSWNYVYVVDDDNDVNNYLGLSFSLYGGNQGGWELDIPDSLGDIGNYGVSPYTIRITSLTMMTNGVLTGYDANSNRCFYRTKTTLWNECTANPDTVNWPGIGYSGNRSGNPLPHRSIFVPPGAAIDTSAWYSYGHINNQLIAIDQKNCNGTGAFYSNDTGRNWTAFSGLPSSPMLCVESPFEEVCLIGTAGSGLYILNTNTNTWQANNNGLAKNLVVRSIVGKETIYKNGTTVKGIYLATNVGIYLSTDGGNNWTLTIPGNFTAIY